MSTRGRFLRSVAFLGTAIVSGSAKAGWLSWVGVGLTLGAIVSAGAGGPVGVGVGGVLVVGEIGCIAVDVIGTLGDRYSMNDYDDPAIAAFQGPAFEDLLNTTFPNVDFLADSHPAVNAATNSYIASLNQFITHVRENADDVTIACDHAELALALENLSSELQEAGLADLSLSVQQLDQAQASIPDTGLPTMEVAYLERAGLGSEFMQAFEDLHMQVDTAVLDVPTAGDLIDAAAESEWIAMEEIVLSSPEFAPAPPAQPVQPPTATSIGE